MRDPISEADINKTTKIRNMIGAFRGRWGSNSSSVLIFHLPGLRGFEDGFKDTIAKSSLPFNMVLP